MTLNLHPPALNNLIKLPISAKRLLSLLTFYLVLLIIYYVGRLRQGAKRIGNEVHVENINEAMHAMRTTA